MSVLAIMKNGQAIETVVIGREGMVGGEIASVGAQSVGQAMVQAVSHLRGLGTNDLPFKLANWQFSAPKKKPVR